MRASAYIAILKDILMVVAIVITGLAVRGKRASNAVFHAASQHVANAMNAHQLTFSMSTMLFQSLGFYVMPFAVQNFFTAKSANTIRRTQVAMPLYMLMYPFLVVASYYAIAQNVPLASPNEAFFAAVDASAAGLAARSGRGGRVAFGSARAGGHLSRDRPDRHAQSAAEHAGEHVRRPARKW